jgi:hypothetical protein
MLGAENTQANSRSRKSKVTKVRIWLSTQFGSNPSQVKIPVYQGFYREFPEIRAEISAPTGINALDFQNFSRNSLKK